jgi:hypothetical protein
MLTDTAKIQSSWHHFRIYNNIVPLLALSIPRASWSKSSLVICNKDRESITHVVAGLKQANRQANRIHVDLSSEHMKKTSYKLQQTH